MSPLAGQLRERRAALPPVEQDLDAGADFVLWSAELIHARTVALLPPRWNRQQLAEAAASLADRLESAPPATGQFGEWPAPTPEADPTPATPTLNLFDVLRLARQALETARAHRQIDVSPAAVTVEEMIRWIESELAAEGTLDANVLLNRQGSAERAVALFLAILELGREAQIRIEQEGVFAPIRLHSCGATVPEQRVASESSGT
jgi:chromatin segregation and condensation protein Rec8/ScpA/Scc1 (kleisin family)